MTARPAAKIESHNSETTCILMSLLATPKLKIDVLSLAQALAVAQAQATVWVMIMFVGQSKRRVQAWMYYNKQ